MKAILYEAPEKVAIKEIPTPNIGPDEALVTVEACGLCGTDLVKIFSGNLKPPVPLGHEVSGRITQIGHKVRGFKPGDRVIVAHHVPCYQCHYCKRGSESMCREFKVTNIDPGGFSQIIRVSGKHLKRTVFKIPPKLDFLAASQMEPLACCLRNARRLNLHKGDVVAIVGLGAIGLMMAQVLLHRKATVIGIDLYPERIRIAGEMGVRHVIGGDARDAGQIIRKLSAGRGADTAIFTAGTPTLAAESFSWLRDGGTINIFASFHPQAEMPLDLNAVYYREITLLSSYSAAPEDLREAVRLLADKKIRLDPYIRDVFPLDRFDDAVRQVRSRQILKAILLPQNGRHP